jgi:hypothetical protein
MMDDFEQATDQSRSFAENTINDWLHDPFPQLSVRKDPSAQIGQVVGCRDVNLAMSLQAPP